MSVSYQTIISKAKNIKKNVETEYKLGEASTWSYYIAKEVIKRTKTVEKIKIGGASKSTGNNFGRQITKSQYLDMAKRLCKFVEKHNQLPNNIKIGNKLMRVSDYTYMFARILVYYDLNKKLPNYANVNSKSFIKPSETGNAVYDYFVDVFGSFGDTIDGALGKVSGKGYGYYYDDVYSNKESINRMKSGKGVNCTDSCHVFYNIMLALINKGKYKKVECLHIKCRGGDGHVRLRITLNNGDVIYRDPASVLDGNGVTSNWCMNGTLLAVNPSWFLQNLNK